MIKNKTSAAIFKDCYKVDHRRFYPEGTTFVSSNLTARSSKYAPIPKAYHDDKVVFFGAQYMIKEYLIDFWNETFFNRDEDEACKEYEDFIFQYLGPNDIGSEHIRELHRYGRLPIRIKALKEGSRVPIQIPMLVIENTQDKFFWVTNFLETIISCAIWKPIVNSTTAFAFKRLLSEWCEKTGGDLDSIQFQAHDFSFRGMSGVEDACVSGMSHLTSFSGSDTMPSSRYAEIYYNANLNSDGSNFDGITAASVSATEHSVSCLSIVDIEESLIESGSYNGYNISDYGEYGDVKEVAEYLMMKRYLRELHPSGIISIVADSFDYFSVLSNILPKLKDTILSREGKFLPRPDSGIPLNIICGYKSDGINYPSLDEGRFALNTYNQNPSTSNKNYDSVMVNGKYYIQDGEGSDIKLISNDEYLGSLNIIWDIFGGEINDKGFKVLDPHVGLIYGYSINFDSCENILSRMHEMGFCSTNVVFGIGSWTYNGPITRDSYGMAVKATFGIVNGKDRNIEKDPKTGSGKKSAKGLLAVLLDDDGEMILRQEVPYEEYVLGVDGCQLEVVFDDGKLIVDRNFNEIKKLLRES